MCLCVCVVCFTQEVSVAFPKDASQNSVNKLLALMNAFLKMGSDMHGLKVKLVVLTYLAWGVCI